MYLNVLCKRCPDCAVVTGGGQQHRHPLRPIMVEWPFQKFGSDTMTLPHRDIRHMVAFQDVLTKWPMAFSLPNLRSEWLVSLLCEEIQPMFGIPETLPSD